VDTALAGIERKTLRRREPRRISLGPRGQKSSDGEGAKRTGDFTISRVPGPRDGDRIKVDVLSVKTGGILKRAPPKKEKEKKTVTV